jgi:DNA-binding NarL/FixJ family response regulator
MTSRLRVLIADDEASVRDALSALLQTLPNVEIVGTALDAGETVALASQMQPDVALLDVRMAGGGGAWAASEIRQTSPRTRILALSAYEDVPTVVQMLQSGAVGYLVKGCGADELVATIDRVAQGEGAPFSADHRPGHQRTGSGPEPIRAADRGARRAGLHEARDELAERIPRHRRSAGGTGASTRNTCGSHTAP